jgi:dienelactone hydrolase
MSISRRNALILSAAAATGLQASRAQAAIKTQWVDYKEGDTALRGYLAYDDSVTSKRPGVLLAHRRDGMTDLTVQNAEMVAKQGYVVFALDIFGRDHQPKDVPQQIEASGSFNKNRPLMRARTQAGFDILRQNPLVDTSKIAVLGYCFGGTVAIEFATSWARRSSEPSRFTAASAISPPMPPRTSRAAC